jgi:peptide/nickel transport system permease protein
MSGLRPAAFVAVGAIALIAVAAPLLGLPNPVSMDVAHRLAPPSEMHWLGQGEFGRNVLSRLIWGARVSLSVAAASASLACIVGVTLGLAGGFLGPVAELLAIRSMDVVLCFTPLLLAPSMVTLFGPGRALSIRY